ncbi:MAG: phytanoyl-CoA dioxygenase family protein [Planctomycetes bacterium]|nr:phytanoyl-CoA dioxygenase family protein [Planctomycetota bacterium]
MSTASLSSILSSIPSSISRSLLDTYQEDGCISQRQVFSPEQAEFYKKEFYRHIEQDENNPQASDKNMSAFHQHQRWAYDICTTPAIVDVMSQLLESDDVVLWAMHFWYKEPHNKTFIPWHQDANYWPMEPAINATAWLALGETFVDNGCLRLILGTHKSELTHSEQSTGSAFAQGISEIDESKALNLEMNAGEAVFFNELCVHGSQANISDTARVACSIRYTTPEVKFLMEEWAGDVERIKTYLVKGEDRFRYNDTITGNIPS